MSISERASSRALAAWPADIAVRIRSSKDLAGIILVAPAILTLVALLAYPVLYNLWLGFHQKHALQPTATWVGLQNYAYFLFSDRQFWDSFWLGLVYAIITVVAQLVMGVAAALLLNEDFRGRLFVRGVALFPYMIPITLSVIIWRWIFNNQYGVANYLIVGTGLADRPPVWLGPEWIFWTLIAVSVWTFFPFVLISILARLQTIPPELYDAAKVDGAGAVGRFLHITLPQIKTVLFIVILLRSVWMFTKFDIVWMWGGQSYGGLGEHVRILPMYTYHRIFGLFQAGEGAALANIMFFILLFAAYFYFKYFRQEEAAV
ncbi:MAG: sugar ABC transporter permease [Chloroflexota bacterium]|nr:sugar ABC transporter permease [Chloroflexota bacterium]